MQGRDFSGRRSWPGLLRRRSDPDPYAALRTTACDVATLAAVAAVLGVAAMLASYIPANCAAYVNPVEALRAE